MSKNENETRKFNQLDRFLYTNPFEDLFDISPDEEEARNTVAKRIKRIRDKIDSDVFESLDPSDQKTLMHALSRAEFLARGFGLWEEQTNKD